MNGLVVMHGFSLWTLNVLYTTCSIDCTSKSKDHGAQSSSMVGLQLTIVVVLFYSRGPLWAQGSLQSEPTEGEEQVHGMLRRAARWLRPQTEGVENGEVWRECRGAMCSTSRGPVQGTFQALLSHLILAQDAATWPLTGTAKRDHIWPVLASSTF